METTPDIVAAAIILAIPLTWIAVGLTVMVFVEGRRRKKTETKDDDWF